MDFWPEFISNKVLSSAVTGWFAAQFLKTLLDLILNRSFNPERLVGSGGMPSSHSATVTGLTVSAAFVYGTGSFEFTISFVLAMIVMYDAMGVRRETGKQSMLLNIFLSQYPLRTKEDFQKKLKEYVGHTPLQVLAGAILGGLIAVVICTW